MPKVVDHAQRREQICRAAARLIEREGVQSASVRRVAVEAGIEPSTLRHYFRSAEDMLAAVIDMVRRDQEKRMQIASGEARAPREAILDAWREALPLDAVRATEAHVWLGIAAAARAARLHAVLKGINDGLDELCRATVRVLAPGADAATESMMLRAFTDGLAVNAVIAPSDFSPVVVDRLLQKYVDRLMAM